MSQERYQSIQCLRGAAAFLVLSAHVVFLIEIGPSPLSFLFWGGGAGVDVFFVISGFVIAMAAEKNQTAATFFRARLARVLPLYLIASAPFFLFTPLSPAALWNTFLFAPALDFGTYTNPAHRFGWTIGVEFWFYTLFALTMLAAPRLRLLAFCIALSAIVAVSALYPGDWTAVRFFGLPLSFEFVAGVALYQFRDRLGPRIARTALPVGAIALVIAMATFPTLGRHEPLFEDPALGFLRLAVWGGPSAFIVAGAVAAERAGLLSWPRSFVWFGDISYSFYLAQPLVLINLVAIDFPHWSFAWAALFAATLLVGAAGRRYIEIPIAARLARYGRPDAVRAATA